MTEAQTITPEPIETAQPIAAYGDYWGADETYKFMLPDGKQYFEIAPMNEGAKTKFQKMTNKGIKMNQRTSDATIDVDPAGERHTLIRESVISWFLMQRDPKDPSGFSEFPCPAEERMRQRALDTLLEKFNPKVIQDLEFFIRTKNPWMQADMDLDDLYEERDRIDELIKQKREQDSGESSSANK